MIRPLQITPDLGLSAAAREILSRARVSSPSQLQQPSDRAELSFEALKTNMGTARLLEKPGGNTASAWTLGQTMVAALDVSKLTGSHGDFDTLFSQLAKYKEPGGGYGPNTDGKAGTGARFYDDNAWIGLALMQAYNQVDDPGKKAAYLADAKGIFDFLKTGQQSDGGLIWEEKSKQPTYNTCTEGPATELALRLHLATAANIHDTSDEYFSFASQVYDHMQQHLLIQSGPKAGLYADNVNVGQGNRVDDIWSYNEGTPVGAGALFYRITGQEKYLDQARATANASLQYFAKDDALQKQPPVFNAIYLRNLLQLEGAPSPIATLRSYNERAWGQSLNPASALFDQPSPTPLGHYGGDPGKISTIDQAALVQLQALQGLPAQTYPDIS